MKILLIEDDPVQRRLTEAALRKAGHEVTVAEDMTGARRALEARQFGMVLLDRQLGAEDALQLVPEIKRDPSLGIIVMSSMSDAIDRVVGLEVGADDYIGKPVEPRELVVRIRRLSERLSLKSPDMAVSVLQVGSGQIDLDRGLLVGASIRGELTALEVRVLRVLSAARGRVLSRDQMLDHVHGSAASPNDRSIDICISRLRRKVTDILGAQVIQTVRGSGYRFISSV
jgi:DNA-binding response OmpR family regulator